MSEALLKHSRLPKKYERKPKANQVAKPAVLGLGKLAGADPRQVLQRYLSDESTSIIAADYGVTRQALGQFLLKHAEEEWKEAQVARAIARKEKAEDLIEVANDPLELAKARELLKAAQWDLERVCRRIYGEDRTINVNVSVDRGERLRRAWERVEDVQDVRVVGGVGRMEGAPSGLSLAPARDSDRSRPGENAAPHSADSVVKVRQEA